MSDFPFRVSYCPEYPISGIDFDRTPRPERDGWRSALASNIEANGLVNPLIVLNHRPLNEASPNWLMVGTNRLWAVRSLGWTTVPAVVTGDCRYPCSEVPTWEELGKLFKDGLPYLSGFGIALVGTTPPESRTYPKCP